MEELTYCCIDTEEENYDRFCEVYKEEICTPDGFCIVCINPRERAKHICGGAEKKFQKDRARRLEWPKYILLNPDKRKVLRDTTTGYIIFFFEKKKIAYAVICHPLSNGKLNLISGFIVGSKRRMNYSNGKPPYEFYRN